MHNIINTSQWLQIQYHSKIFFTPNQTVIDRIEKNPEDWQFWRRMQTPFVCVIYDASLKEIIAVRDHFGVEPAYYTHINAQFIFGSTIPSILKHIKSVPEINTSQITNLFFNKLFNTETYSDETYYQSIYRFEPGHELRVNLNATKASYHKKAFWDLRKLDKPPVRYSNNMDYVEHFSELLSEALKMQVGDEKNCALEFSGGLDSSAIIASAHDNNIHPTLVMHVPPPNSDVIDDMQYAQIVIDKLAINDVHYIDGSDFDLMTSMDEYAQYFAGGAAYVGSILASNIHRALTKHQFKTVLSGIGGDECVSGHAPLRAYIPHLLREHNYKKAWDEITCQYHFTGQIAPNKFKRLLHLMKFANPRAFSFMQSLTDINFRLKTYLKNLPAPRKPNVYHSLNQYEYHLLQGSACHHLRMRVEYAAVAAKAMGFNYVYPLLYPKLIEFCYQLPLELKRFNGVNRFIIRQYLARFFSPELYNKHSKIGSVIPATMEKVKAFYNSGTSDKFFSNLPFEKERHHTRKYHKKMCDEYRFIQDIPAYMFKSYWESIS